jgi:formylglycine-generating enzyme required for sulfatase activity/predicted Ser/Thr protein kinase
MNLVSQCIRERYDVLSLLGQGGMSAVYLAQDRLMPRTVALKTIRPDQSDGSGGERTRLALLDEATMASRLNHPGIVTIHDRFELDGWVCIVMEYVEGLTLEKAIRIGAFTDRTAALRILFRIADALDYAHGRGVVHRDIKPSNILIRTDVPDAETKIADFGIARETSRGAATSTTAMGTLGYMAPEQAQGRRVDGRADQFSLAIVAHELLTGNLPYPSKQAVGILAPAPDPALGTSGAHAFRAALNPIPESRYPSCRDFVTALEWSLRPAQQPLPTPEFQHARPGQQFWKSKRFAALSGLFVLAAGFAIFWQFRPTNAIGSSATNAKDGLEYVWIPKGEFQMGCVPNDPDCDPDEKPRHAVTLTKGFWMGRTDVTVAAYESFVGATGGKMPEAPEFNPSWRERSHPVVNVSWDEASAFCEWVGGRLPTEAEWEYAARAGKDGNRYPWGDTIDHADANYGSDDGRGGLAQGADRWVNTSPVGSFPANDWGLVDMSGNVLQWTKDWYAQTYYGSSAPADPHGPISGIMHIFRGGAWTTPAKMLRSSWRFWGTPDARRDFIGFRCAMDQAPVQR